VRSHTAKCIVVAELISKSPAVGVGNASEPSADVTIRGSARGCVRTNQRVRGEVPVFLCLRTSSNHVTEVGGQ